MYVHRLRRARRNGERGVTLIEMMIAIVILTIGLAALAQLFVVSLRNSQYAVTTSGGVNDAQWLVENWKIAAKDDATGIENPLITSATWDEDSGECAAFAALPDYDSANSQYKESVWVFDRDGTLVGSADPDMPDGFSDGDLQAPSTNSRLVYIVMEPKSSDPRINQRVTMTAIITGEDPTP